VQSIYELNDIYKELNSLVILQGSLLDRIDQNIDAAQQAVASGAEHLTKAERRQKRTGRCACGVILGQLVAIGILLIVLMSKWMR
jgi:syntaxin 16